MKNNFNHVLTVLGVLGVCALASAALADEQNPNGHPMASDADMNAPVTAQHFVWEAAMTDRKEIHLGEVALQKSDNPDVKNFAKHIISDHQKACKKLQAIAEKEGLNFPDTNAMASDGWHTNWNGNPNWSSNAEANASIDTNNPLTASSAGIGHQNYKGAEVMELGKQMATNSDNEAGMNPDMNLEMLSGAEFDRAYAGKMVMGHEKAISKFEAAAATLPDPDLKKYAEKTLPTLREHLRMAQDLQNKVGGTYNSSSGMQMGRP